MGESRLRMTADEYLAFERTAQGKHELWDAEVYAMSGASLGHNRIVRNLVRHLGNVLEGSDCEVLPSDMRVRVPERRYVYPDVTIVCGPPQLEGDADVLLNPRIVIEVLSPSTAAFDRGEKLTGYRSIPSVREIILVRQDAAQLELYTRQPDDSWLLRDYASPAAVPLMPLSSPLSLELVYEGVALGPAA